MKTVIFILLIGLFACQPQKDEVLHKQIDTLNMKLNTIYQLLESKQIGKIDSLEKIKDYNILIWRKK